MYYYLIISNNTTLLFSKKRIASIVVVVILFCLNIGVFVLKNYVLLKDFQGRNPIVVDAFISKNIPSGSKVIGDELFFYSVLKSGSDFQYMTWYDTHVNREIYHREKYDYDYVIWTERLGKQADGLYKVYSDKSYLAEIADFSSSTNNSHVISKLGLNISDSYSCKIFKRIK